MTTDPHQTPQATSGGPVPPDELLAAGDRRARERTLAERAEHRQRRRRRILPAALVGASVLSLAGIADRFVTGTLPSQAAAITTPTATTGATPTTGATSTAAGTTLAQVARTLAADQQAIAALARAQAQLARNAGGDGGGSSALPAIQLPSLPSLPSSASISVPAPAPATHATTGASVVVP